MTSASCQVCCPCGACEAAPRNCAMHHDQHNYVPAGQRLCDRTTAVDYMAYPRSKSPTLPAFLAGTCAVRGSCSRARDSPQDQDRNRMHTCGCTTLDTCTTVVSCSHAWPCVCRSVPPSTCNAAMRPPRATSISQSTPKQPLHVRAALTVHIRVRVFFYTCTGTQTPQEGCSGTTGRCCKRWPIRTL